MTLRGIITLVILAVLFVALLRLLLCVLLFVTLLWLLLVAA